ncbi:acid phosphatase type 7-like [Mya arenaria]|uniref:acid phosphatase type 7-like n=1 Tax=Mya arenaria TaxID=6604 RepID=UPI0022E3DC23|nr:acid phosphatase type 7-like [Mya arenaria]
MKLESTKMFWLLIFSTILSMCRASIETDKVQCDPEQVHLAFGDRLTEMVVSWATPGECESRVQYGSGPWDMTTVVQATREMFTYSDGVKPPIYMYRALLNNLEPGTTYYYLPVSNNVTDEPFFFKTPPMGQAWSPEFIVYGDLGIHSESLTNLKQEVLKGKYTALLHVGDFGYNLYDSVPDGQYAGENVGDIFMRQIEEIAAHVPYMTSPGNHEIEPNESFKQYRYRFSMPNTDWPIPLNKMWYSIDIGPVHFLSYSTEVFFLEDKRYIESQRQWISVDLETANKNRHTTPWIVALGHRPMYCSNNDGDDCTKEDSLVKLGLEDIFYNNGVDVILQAHEHSYERLWPMYKSVVLAKNFTNPHAPVQIITGAAGNKHGVDPMNPVNATWSAFRMDNRSLNSFGRLKVDNSSHLYWEQVAVFGGEVLDSIWITQESHGPFSHNTLPADQQDKIREQTEVDEQNIDKHNLRPKPETTGDTLTEKVSKAIKGADVRVIIGISFGAFVVLFLLIVCIVKSCSGRRVKSYRRWETLDYGKKFYSTVKNDDKEADDFEVDVTDGTTKLISTNID